MKVYQTSYLGYFVAELDADESPLEPGVFHIPGGCVVDPPPSYDPAVQLARHVDGAWRVEDIPEPEPEPEPEE